MAMQGKMESKSLNKTVAIIGSGPAGVFAAWALHRDGFDVTILEKENHLTLDGHSYRLKDDAVVSIPMRTFSGKYYANLFQVLNYLGIETQVHRFHYVFMENSQKYFQFFSNFHKVAACFDNGVLLAVQLLLCYVWFTIASFLISPRIVSPDTKHTETETLEEYTRRIWLPDAFLDRYMLPLFSSMATCSHDDLRRFPAAYVMDYKRGTFRSHHRTVPDMGMLQDRLTEKVKKRFNCEVVSVTSHGKGVVVEYRKPDEALTAKEVFGHVILATSSAVAYRIHKASSSVTGKLLSRPVQVSVFPPSSQELISSAAQRGSHHHHHHHHHPPSEILILDTKKRTSTSTQEEVTITQSVHLPPLGPSVIVSADVNAAMETQGGNPPLHTVTLYRPIPSPESHRILLPVLARGYKSSYYDGWKNGDRNVYLAGGYASAGLPLLEACVRSGLEAAEAIGATLPFDLIRQTPF